MSLSTSVFSDSCYNMITRLVTKIGAKFFEIEKSVKIFLDKMDGSKFLHSFSEILELWTVSLT
jgi:hypothetical protein